MRDMLPILEEARLGQVAAAAERELQIANDWPGWVEQMRTTLPHKTRAADRRHPTHPENANRDWTRPATDLEQVRTRPRWQLNIALGETTVGELQHNETYRPKCSFPEGAEKALAQYLIEHDIEVAGLPRHGGSNDQQSGDGGFTSALANAITEERARARTRSR